MFKKYTRLDILQGQAVFLRVKQNLLFIFELQRERQKKHTVKKDRQTEKNDGQKRHL